MGKCSSFYRKIHLHYGPSFRNCKTKMECWCFTHEGFALTFHKVHFTKTQGEFPARFTKPLPGACYGNLLVKILEPAGQHPSDVVSTSLVHPFFGKKVTSFRTKKHQDQCVNDDPMIPSCIFLEVTHT